VTSDPTGRSTPIVRHARFAGAPVGGLQASAVGMRFEHGDGRGLCGERYISMTSMIRQSDSLESSLWEGASRGIPKPTQ
jgi:hypothetical protein